MFLLSGLIALLIVIIFVSPIIGQNVQANLPIHPEWGNTQDVGVVLFTKYLIPFEVAAIMLLVAMVGGIILAGKRMNTSYTQLSENQIEEQKEDL